MSTILTKNKMNGIKKIDSFTKMFCPIQKWQDVTKMTEQIAGQFASRQNSLFPNHMYRHRFGKFSQNPGWLLGSTKDTIVQWLRLLPNMEWFPHPLPTLWKVVDNVHTVDGHMVPYSACYHHLSCPRFGNPSKILSFTAAAGLQITTLCNVRGSNPNGMVPISPAIIWKLLANLLMVWRGIWSHHQVISTTCMPRFGKSFEIPVPSALLGYMKWHHWHHCQWGGSHPTWNGSHILSEHSKLFHSMLECSEVWDLDF